MTTVTQANYNVLPEIGIHGAIADLTAARVLSKRVEDATLGAGLAVIQGTDDAEVKVGAAGTFIGIAVLDPTRPPSQTDDYAEGDIAAVMYKGTVFLTAPATIAAGQPAYYTATGAITNASSGNTLIVGAMFERSAASGAITVLRLR